MLLRPLLGLLQDSDARVRLAALEATSSHHDAALIPVIASLLDDPSVDQAAARALVPFGTDALAHLGPLLAQRDEEGAFRGALLVPDIMAKIGDSQALSALRKCIDSPDLSMRKRAVLAYCSLIGSSPLRKPQIRDLQNLVAQEMDLAHKRRVQQDRLRDVPGSELLVHALEETSRVHLRCAFTMLDALVPGVELMGILESLQKVPDRRANALEILDNVLPAISKTAVLHFFEGDTDAVQQPFVSDEILGFVQKDESVWMIVGALLVAVAHQRPLSVVQLSPALTHADVIVRETALFALHEQGDPAEFSDQCKRFEQDPDPALRQFARSLVL